MSARSFVKSSGNASTPIFSSNCVLLTVLMSDAERLQWSAFDQKIMLFLCQYCYFTDIYNLE